MKFQVLSRQRGQATMSSTKNLCKCCLLSSNVTLEQHQSTDILGHIFGWNKTIANKLFRAPTKIPTDRLPARHKPRLFYTQPVHGPSTNTPRPVKTFVEPAATTVKLPWAKVLGESTLQLEFGFVRRCRQWQVCYLFQGNCQERIFDSFQWVVGRSITFCNAKIKLSFLSLHRGVLHLCVPFAFILWWL